MNEENKVEYLIVDTSAFIKNTALQDVGVNIITDQAVVDEITNKRQLRRLVALPYDLDIKNAFPEDIKFVTEFSKKTGDYISLSATDIKVIALTYRLHKEKIGTDGLKEAPTVVKTIGTNKVHTDAGGKPLVGFYMPEKNEQPDETSTESTEQDLDENVHQNESEILDAESKLHSDDSYEDSESDYETAPSESDSENVDDLEDKFAKLACTASVLEVEDNQGDKHNVDDILPSLTNKTHDNNEDDVVESEDSEEEEEEEDDDDDSGWITPYNIKDVKKQMDSERYSEKEVAKVACLTTDFAMQNVLLQIGLNVAALDGRVIKQMRTFIFRCYACFKTTSNMTKVFCPNCGNKTLKKVAVSVDDNGEQKIHINFRKPLSARGKRFSLPMPKGGKHANNPILCEDQPMPQQRLTRLARTRNDPLDENYIAGYSPFVMRDVNSRSAMLGIRPGETIKYWMRRNPNESRKKRK